VRTIALLSSSFALVASSWLAQACTGDDASVPDDRDAGASSAGDAATADALGSDGATASDADAASIPEPDVDTIPWETGATVGFGVASKDTQNPRGHSAAIVYGGYQSTLANAEGWTTALYKAELRNRGVRWLYAVQGPNTIQYVNKEIGNTSILAALIPKVDAATKFVLVLGHSSGSYVAHELLGQVAGTFDPNGVLTGKLVYFDLDGGRDGFTAAIATRMRKAYFVSPKDVAKGTLGFNNASMESAGADYPALGGTLPFDSSTAGCNAGASGCVHDSLVIDRPHSPTGASANKDYDDYSGGRTVTTRYLVQKGTEAGLVP
jgi:hypothetical protein